MVQYQHYNDKRGKTRSTVKILEDYTENSKLCVAITWHKSKIIMKDKVEYRKKNI